MHETESPRERKEAQETEDPDKKCRSADGTSWEEFSRKCDAWLKSRGLDSKSSGSFVHYESGSD
jgi:hypothetical protein